MKARLVRVHNYDPLARLVATRDEASQGRISAKPLRLIAVTAGKDGSPRTFRGLVATTESVTTWDNHRGRVAV